MSSVKGSVYKRGRYWWIQYIDSNGERHQESCETTKKTVAREILNQRLELVAKDEPIIAEKVKFGELLEDLETHYKLKKQELKPSIKKSLMDNFGGMIASRITTADIEHFIVELQKEKEDSDKKKKKGLSAATVNRRLAAIKTAFRLGMKRTPPKVTRAPHIPMLTEDNVRAGFLEHHQAIKLRDALPPFLQGFFWFGYSTGWRIDEIRTLTDKNFDELGRTIRLFPGTTKNKEGRTLYLDDDLFSIIQTQRQNRPAGCKHLFYGETGGEIKDIRGSWKASCKAAGVAGLLFHDLRRSSVRNSIRAGIPEKVCMAISGHKTRAVFDRYNIVSEADLREATIKKEAYLKGKENGLLQNLLQLDDFRKKANGENQ